MPDAPPISTPSRRRDALFLLGVALLYVPALGLGYGADDDAYRLVRAGRSWLETGHYQPSRNPGYPVVEAAVGVLDRLGGSLATNAGTLAMALVAVGAFLGVARRMRVPRPELWALALAVQPFVWANAAVTMDHVWALGFVLAGWRLLLDRRGALAGILLGLAVGSRLTAALVVAAVLLHAASRDRRSALVAVIGAGLVGAACVALPASEAGWTLAFLRPAWLDLPEVWTPTLRVGRWAYKSATFWGLPVALALLAVTALAWRERERLRPAVALFVLAGGVVLCYEALYARYPLDRAYLLPTAPFVLLAAAAVLAERPRWAAGLVALIALSALVRVDLARPDRPFAATGARFGVWVGPGPVVEQVRIRQATRACQTVACWAEATGYADRAP